MPGSTRVAVGLALLAGAVVLAQAAAPTMDTGLVASPKDAKFVLNRCIQLKPGYVWLYLLRAYA